MSNNHLDICKAGIQAWQTAFNQGNAAGCAARYCEDAVMEAVPYGRFVGKAAIEAFWQNIMDQGLNDVSYQDVQWQAAGDDGYILSAKWQMNKAFGVVHREHWVIEEDGEARLLTDKFEVFGER